MKNLDNKMPAVYNLSSIPPEAGASKFLRNAVTYLPNYDVIMLIS
jgi:hypothetical protein